MKKVIPAMPMLHKGFLFELNKGEWFMGVCVTNKEFLGEAIAMALSSPIKDKESVDAFTRSLSG